MSLRKSTYFAILVTFLGLMLLLIINSNSILSAHFQTEERLVVTQNLERASSALENEYRVLILAANEAARRGEADGALAGEYQVSFTAQYMPGSGRWTGDNLPAGLDEALPEDSIMFKTAGARGMLSAAGQPLLIALAADESGRYFAAGQTLDENVTGRVSEMLNLTVRVRSLQDTGLAAADRDALQALKGGQASLVTALDDNQVAGYTLLKDAKGQAVGLLSILQGRSSYRSGQVVLNYLITFLVAAGFIFAAVISLLLERMVLTRLRRLDREVNAIGQTGDFSQRVTVDHSDELASLSRNMNKTLAALDQAQAGLKALSQKLVEVEEDERRHLAQELHDEIGQALTGLKLTLNSGALTADHQRQAMSQVNDLIARVRQISLDLRPTILDDLGLLPALLWLIQRYQEQTGVKVNFQHTNLEGQRLAPRLEEAAYRLVQESLTNVARHARVEAVDVNVGIYHQELLIQIEDTGVGFIVEKVIHNGDTRGLMGMRERVTALGGTFAIESNPDQGTLISIELPLEYAAETAVQ